MNSKKTGTSLFEHTFDDSYVLKECKFFLPMSLKDNIKRLFLPFGYKRGDITFKKLRAVADYLSDKGILKTLIFPTIQSNDLPPCHVVKAVHSERIYGHSSEYGKPSGISFAVSLGELLERFFTFKKRGEDSFLTVLRKKRLKMVPLEFFNGYLEEQIAVFPDLRQQNQTLYSHEICTRFATGKKVLIPSQFIYWGFDHKRESTLLNQTTSGSGAFYNREEAILSGLYELIQRDSFFLMWLARQVRNYIDIDTIPKEKKVWPLVEEIQSRGIKIYFLTMGHDVPIHSIGCLLVDERTDFPIVGLGASAGCTLEYCLENSLKEALSVLSLNLRSTGTFDMDTYSPFVTKGIWRRDRLTMWKGELVRGLNFLRAGNKIPYGEYEMKDIRFTSKKEELSWLVKLLEEKGPGYEVYVHDSGSKIIRKLGFCVVKVIVPQLFPLYLEETSATLSSERLARVFGVQKKDLHLSMFNPYPHPFP